MAAVTAKTFPIPHWNPPSSCLVELLFWSCLGSKRAWEEEKERREEGWRGDGERREAREEAGEV